MDSMAASFRSVLKTLNSVSSATNAAPVSSRDGRLAVGRGGGVGQGSQGRFVAGNQGLHGLFQEFTVVCKIRNYLQRVAEGHDSHQIGRRHLFAQILLGGARRAQQIFRLERRHVKEHHDHPVIADDGLDFLG